MTTKQKIVAELSKSLNKELAEQHADIIGGIFESFLREEIGWHEKNEAGLIPQSLELITTAIKGIIDINELNFE